MRYQKIFLIIVAVLWATFILGAVSVYLFFTSVDKNWFGWYGGKPSIERLQNPSNSLASEIYSMDGKLLGKYFRENRTNAEFEELSPNLIAAIYSTEDIRFDRHSGIDLKGVISIAYYLAKGDKRGASTITQQLAKNLFDTRRDSTWEGKLHGINKYLDVGIDKAKEWLLAVQLEKLYTKKEIMTLYFNTVDFGSNSHGIRTAAGTFFSTTPDSLTIEEAAVLVGVLKAPTRYSPVLNEKSKARIFARRNSIIRKMARYGFITQAVADSVVELPMKLTYKVEKHFQGEATYFREELKKTLTDWCDSAGYDLYSDGLKIYTTINNEMQLHAEKAVHDHMKWLQSEFFKHWKNRGHPWGEDDRIVRRGIRESQRYRDLAKLYQGNEDSIMAVMNKPTKMRIFTHDGEVDTIMSPIDSVIYTKYFLRAGLVSIEPMTGSIRAWVGGIDYKYFKYDHVRQGRRQPGSAFKPIIYSSWIDKGYTPCYKVLDAPVTFYQDMGDGESRKWTPKNAEGSWSGRKLTLRQGLAWSKNSVSAYLMKQMGPEIVVENAKKLGITAPLEPVPALSLGSGEVNVLELVSAYTTFVNLGKRVEPNYLARIEDRYGNIIRSFVPRTYEVFSPETCYMMLYLMQATNQIKGGTAQGLWRYSVLKKGNEVAGKTGTTNDHADGWFIGLTRDLATGVWVGGEDRSVSFRTITLGQGAKMAMPIWGLYMDMIYANEHLPYKRGKFRRPQNFDYALINCDDQGVEKDQGNDSTQVIAEPEEELEF